MGSCAFSCFQINHSLTESLSLNSLSRFPNLLLLLLLLLLPQISHSSNPETMQVKALALQSHLPLLHDLNSKFLFLEPRPVSFSAPRIRFRKSWSASSSRDSSKLHGNKFASYCVSSGKELIESEVVGISGEDSDGEVRLGGLVEEGAAEELGDQSIWSQMKEIAMFTGPATGLWICGPLMSLIDTVVIGQGSSIELAALGPGTVICDYMSYLFMFLSIATSNMVATSLAREDKNEVQHQISVLLFVGLTCGFLMLFFTKFFGSWALTAFTGQKNLHIVPAANTYVQIRGLAWPAILIGWVAQSASLGMKDSWGPLKALAVSSAINGVGDVVLCTFLGYGIAGAAWATMASQVVAAYMMMESLKEKGYNAYSISIPSPSELLTILGIAAPVFITIMSKVAFYSLMIYFATSMGTHIVAAHQVMIQMYTMFTVWGEPLSQTAQSFMPELMYGAKRNLSKAQTLLKSLMIIGTILGLVLGITGASLTGLFPKMFTPDQMVIGEMRKVLIPYFIALAVTPCTLGLEGTLLAGRDLKFASLSMSGCFTLGALLLTFVSSRQYGLLGCWCALVGFQWARFSLSLTRLLSPTGVLFSEDSSQYNLGKLEVA